MNKNCDTELALARLTEVPLRDLGDGCGIGYGYHSKGRGDGRGDYTGNGAGYGYSHGFGYGAGPGGYYGNHNGRYGDGDSAPHEA